MARLLDLQLMTTTITSEKTESYASTIASLYKKKLKNVKIVTNRRLFHKKYPHVIEINDNKPRTYDGYVECSLALRQIATAIKNKVNKKSNGTIHTRVEGLSLRIYTTNLIGTLDSLSPTNRKKITKLEIMEPAVENYITKNPKETYRTVDRVVRKLPYENQRFKVFYTNSSSIRESIGLESLQGILFQLQQYDSIRWTEGMGELIVDKYGNWNETFFYCTDLDWLPIITLIDSRFIKRIERLTIEGEIESI